MVFSLCTSIGLLKQRHVVSPDVESQKQMSETTQGTSNGSAKHESTSAKLERAFTKPDRTSANGKRSAAKSLRSSAKGHRTENELSPTRQDSKTQLVGPKTAPAKVKVGYIRDIPYKYQFCICGLIKIGTGSIIIAIIELIILCHSIIFAAVNVWGGNEKYQLYNPIFANVIKYAYLYPFLVVQLIWLSSNIFLMIGVKAHVHWMLLPHVFIKIVAIISGMALGEMGFGLCISTIANPETETNWELLLSISLFTALIVLEVYFCVVTWICYKYLKLTRVKVKAQKEVLKHNLTFHHESSDDESNHHHIDKDMQKLKTANETLAFSSQQFDFFDTRQFEQSKDDIFVVKPSEHLEINKSDGDDVSEIDLPTGPVTRSKSAKSTISTKDSQTLPPGNQSETPILRSQSSLKSALKLKDESPVLDLGVSMKHVHFDDK